MIDTSVLVAGATRSHQFHAVARPHVLDAVGARLPGPVIAEAWAVLRRAPWNLPTHAVAELLAPWSLAERLEAVTAPVYAAAVAQAATVGAGAGIHDLVIAHVCAASDGLLVTLDRQQAAVALSIEGLEVELLI